MAEGSLKRAPNYYIRRKVRSLCNKYDCDIDILGNYCHLFPATKKQIDMMIEEDDYESIDICQGVN